MNTRLPVAWQHLGSASLLVLAGLAGACQNQKKLDAQDRPAPVTTPATPAAPAPMPGSPGPATPAQSAEELRAPLAKIDDVTITLGELQERINRQSPYIRARYTSLEQKKEFLDSLIRFEVLAKEAARRGLDKDPEVVRTMKQVMIQKLMRDELDLKITADTITDPEMKAYYDANLAEFVKPEEVRISSIIIKNRAQADRVALEARGEPGKTNKGFRDLVNRYSQDEDSKLRGGDLRYFDAQTKDVPAPVVKAAFALVNTGDVSGVVDAGNGTWYVLKQTGRRRSMTKGFDDAKPAIRNKLFRDKRVAAQKDFVDNLKSAAKIEINDANLTKVRIDTTAAVDDGHGHDLPPLPMTPPPSIPPGPPSVTGGPPDKTGAP
ncbi:MAG TPA: peptidyl-prolyl cis-trans isomerase [Kofleriaceae bacterium]|nr:peptidyl-prolyl cis-trans isomerase [Kofleriaceae bacterium]